MVEKEFTERQLSKARKTNVYAYLLAQGEKFDNVGRSVRHAEHDSLMVNPNTGVANWYSQDITSFDNAIGFIMKFYPQSNYEETVQSLLDFVPGKEFIKHSNQMKSKAFERGAFNSKQIMPDTKTGLGCYDSGQLSEKCYSYLRDKRHISEELIDLLKSNSLISTDNRGNLLFNWYDPYSKEKNKVVGADLIGMIKRPIEKRIHKDLSNEKLERPYFKGIGMNSKRDWGFRFSAYYKADVPPTLYVSESPIESISYYELNKENLRGENSTFLSLAGSGTKAEAIYKSVELIKEQYPKADKVKVVMCMNYDDAGLKAIRGVKNDVEERGLPIHLFMELPLEKGMDFNEQLELKKTGNLNSRKEKEADKNEAKKIREKISEKEMVNS